MAADAQSDGDGATPLLTAMVKQDVASGEFYGPCGSEPMLELNSQTKGKPEKVAFTDWEKKAMDQGAQVWADTYAGLGVSFDIASTESKSA